MAINAYTSRLKDRQIRLMRLTPGDHHELRCSLVTRSLDESARYDALSYVWGDRLTKHHINCNGEEFYVTRNLFAALWRLRHRGRDTLLWVDAICINQDDMVEKTAQVRMMSDIYARAQAVVIWLGEEENDAGKAYDLLKLIAALPEDDAQGNGLPKDAFDPSYRSVTRLLTRPWFSRIWVVQEFLMARSSTFVCGRLEIDSAILLDAANKISSRNVLRVRIAWHASATRNIGVATANNLGGLGVLKDLDTDLSLRELLYVTQSYQATDPRDKIFALLALSSDFSVGLIDYDRSSDELVYDVAVQMLHVVGDLPSPLSLLSYAVFNRPRDRSSVPSWAPDWLQPHTVTPVIHLVRDVLETLPESRFFIQPSKILRVQATISDRLATIVPSGSYNMSISGIPLRALPAMMAEVYEWHCTVKTLAYTQKTYPNGLPTEYVFWRSLIADGPSLVHALTPAHHTAYLAWCSLLAWARHDSPRYELTHFCNRLQLYVLTLLNLAYVGYGAYAWISRQHTLAVEFVAWFVSWTFAHYFCKGTMRYMFRRDPRYLSNLETKQRELVQLSDEARPWEDALSRVMPGRQFCRTANAYIGWVSPRAIEDDVVVALQGCPVLFTARLVKEDHSDSCAVAKYEMTGDCYLQGFGREEAFKAGTSVVTIDIV